MTATATADAPPQLTQDEIVRDIIAKLGHENFGTCPLAALRRMDPRAAVQTTPAVHRLLAHNVPEARLDGDGLNHFTQGVMHKSGRFLDQRPPDQSAQNDRADLARSRRHRERQPCSGDGERYALPIGAEVFRHPPNRLCDDRHSDDF